MTSKLFLPPDIQRMIDEAEAERRHNDRHSTPNGEPPPPNGPEDYGQARAANDQAAPFIFDPKPYQFPDPATIPRRQWLYGRHYVRGVVSMTVGAPARAKSTNELTEIIGQSVGRDLMSGEPLECGPLHAAYLNGEENQDELDRRAAAICQRYAITPADCGARLWVVSTRDQPIRLVVLGPKGAAVAQDVVDAMLAWCEARSIDVLAVDPLISFHRVRENDSGDMDLLVKEAFGRIAGKDRAVDLVQHTRKLPAGEVNTTVDDARGSKSAPNRSQMATAWPSSRHGNHQIASTEWGRPTCGPFMTGAPLEHFASIAAPLNGLDGGWPNGSE
jgi:hypothetical protein